MNRIQELKARIAYGDKQFVQWQTLAMYWHAQVVSGACKGRDMFVGTFNNGERPLTDEEKVAEALATMMRHVHNMNELNDSQYILREELAELESE
jgi:hypothetical protein